MKKLITAIYVCYAKVCLQWNCTKSSFQAWELLPHMVYKGNVPLDSIDFCPLCPKQGI